MAIFAAGLPLLFVIALANGVTARGSGGARVAFHLVLFVGHAVLAIAGLALRIGGAGDVLPDVGLLPFDAAQAGAAMLGMGLWGMVVCLRPARVQLARLLPALDVDSTVHTLALVLVGYLAGNAALSLSPGALQALDEANIEATLVDVLAQQFLFVMAAFVGVGLLIRRDGEALNQRLGLARPTARQLLTGVSWMVFFVFLQGCISTIWVLADPAQAEQLGGINRALLGNFDTVWEWFLLAAAAGLGEELLFRGALQPIFGIVPTSLLFALSHAQYSLSPATLAVFLLSLVLGIIRKRSNTTVAILVHAGYNFVLGLLSLLAVYLEPLVR